MNQGCVAMGMDSAIRKLVREMRELVADEVRSQVLGHAVASVPVAHSAAAVPTQGATPPGPTADLTPTMKRPNGGHLVPHAAGDPAQPNFDAAEAAWFLRYPTMKAFYQAVRRYGIPHARRGERVMLFRRADLEKFLASRSRYH